MKTLGVVLAGGRSSRFGSDKADAILLGRTLLEHALDALRMQCDAVVVVGRVTPLAPSIADWPAAGGGPLSGLAGALRYSVGKYDQLLSAPVDAPLLPADLRARLEPGPSCLIGLPVIGLWPVSVSRAVERILSGSGKHSMRALVAETGARLVEAVGIRANINTRDDLIELERRVKLDEQHASVSPNGLI